MSATVRVEHVTRLKQVSATEEMLFTNTSIIRVSVSLFTMKGNPQLCPHHCVQATLLLYSEGHVLGPTPSGAQVSASAIDSSDLHGCHFHAHV